MSLDKPNEHEAPLVHLLMIDLDALTPDELRAHIEKVRSLRAIPAKRTAAKAKSERASKTASKGLDIDSLL